jgi:hypothetical protein
MSFFIIILKLKIMIEIKIDNDKLVCLIKKHTVKIPLIACYEHYVCNAKKLLEEIHTVADDCEKIVFIDFVNSQQSKIFREREKYKEDKRIKTLFENIQFVGKFDIVGHREAGLDSDPFITLRSISHVIPIRF